MVRPEKSPRRRGRGRPRKDEATGPRKVMLTPKEKEQLREEVKAKLTAQIKGPPRTPTKAKPKEKPVDPLAGQVSILVSPIDVTNPEASEDALAPRPVLLNLPLNLARKVKVGTTLSFSNQTKYKVLKTKLHKPVRPGDKRNAGEKRTYNKAPKPPVQAFESEEIDDFTAQRLSQVRKIGESTLTPAVPPKSITLQRQQEQEADLQRKAEERARLAPPKGPTTRNGGKWRSIQTQPVASPSKKKGEPAGPPVPTRTVVAPKPMLVTAHRCLAAAAGKLNMKPSVLASGEVITPSAEVTACTPYSPGSFGFPEMECTGCGVLFHSRCVGIQPSAVKAMRAKFKCRACINPSKPS